MLPEKYPPSPESCGRPVDFSRLSPDQGRQPVWSQMGVSEWGSPIAGWFTMEKILYFVWSPPWHLYILLLANLLAFYLTFYLAFYLAYLLAFYLAYLLAFYLAYLLAFYLAYLLDRGPLCDSTRGGTLMYTTPSVHFQLCERTPHSCSGVNISYIYIYILLF